VQTASPAAGIAVRQAVPPIPPVPAPAPGTPPVPGMPGTAPPPVPNPTTPQLPPDVRQKLEELKRKESSARMGRKQP
jgi:hypothetical protein